MNGQKNININTFLSNSLRIEDLAIPADYSRKGRCVCKAEKEGSGV